MKNNNLYNSLGEALRPENSNTHKPLYKVLNEQRTQGDWKIFDWPGKKQPFYKIGDEKTELIADLFGQGSPDNAKATAEINGQYITLCVNNLHLLAEALEGVIRVADRKTDEFDKAKEALKRIS